MLNTVDPQTPVIQPPWLIKFIGFLAHFKWNQHSLPMIMYYFTYLNFSHIQTRASPMAFKYERVYRTSIWVRTEMSAVHEPIQNKTEQVKT